MHYFLKQFRCRLQDPSNSSWSERWQGKINLTNHSWELWIIHMITLLIHKSCNRCRTSLFCISEITFVEQSTIGQISNKALVFLCSHLACFTFIKFIKAEWRVHVSVIYATIGSYNGIWWLIVTWTFWNKLNFIVSSIKVKTFKLKKRH